MINTQITSGQIMCNKLLCTTLVNDLGLYFVSMDFLKLALMVVGKSHRGKSVDHKPNEQDRSRLLSKNFCKPSLIMAHKMGVSYIFHRFLKPSWIVAHNSNFQLPYLRNKTRIVIHNQTWQQGVPSTN